MPEAPSTHDASIRSSSATARDSTGSGPALDAWTIVVLVAAGWSLLALLDSLRATVNGVERPFQAERLDPRDATLAEWTLIPGVGPALGGRLHAAVPHRNAASLIEVKGIGPVTARNAARHLRLVAVIGEDSSP